MKKLILFATVVVALSFLLDSPKALASSSVSSKESSVSVPSSQSLLTDDSFGLGLPTSLKGTNQKAKRPLPPPYVLPTVDTKAATYITPEYASYRAILNSAVNPNGSFTTVRYQYGTVNNPCYFLSATTSASFIGSGSATISPNEKTVRSLTPKTVYYYCAVATNLAGTAYGKVMSFITAQ